ncbi:hypothetical protein Clacol_002108 [Clathrus columnatus]|uniref:Uncharacterized protein n=1 Tax=Clathrus columnatus TaxID=1419009 RepID=A0AAV5A380_9AGAM|nr:hypothetical protein Clacol_002108 [Clathrus columnatus]
MTGELFIALSRLPQLQDLSLTFWSPGFSFVDRDLRDLPKKKIKHHDEPSKDIPFRSLERIDMSNSDFMMTETLRCGLQLLKLVGLTYWYSSPDLTIAFMGSLHKICPNLEEISISTHVNLPFQAIRSLLKCPALVKIVSDNIVDMDLEAIAIIATNHSSWQVIDLPSAKALSYQALIPFARNCPDLYKLSLTLDSKLGIPDPNTFPMGVKFSSLTLLIVGVSELTPNPELALFLSKICTRPIEITSYSVTWKSIEKLVNVLITTQLEIQTLKDENTLLYAQKLIKITTHIVSEAHVLVQCLSTV